MPSLVPEKIAFLTAEVNGLSARIAATGGANAAQHAKIQMLQDIRSDYVLSLDRAKQRDEEEASE